MKVIREKDKFEPITIVIENEDEADAMWARLNVSVEDVLKRSNRAFDHDTIERLSVPMWKAFNAVYRPK